MKKQRSLISFAKRLTALVVTTAMCISLSSAPLSGNSNQALAAVTQTNVFNISYKERCIANSYRGNDTLKPNAWNYSYNGEFFLVFSKADGNLILYHDLPGNRKAIWSSNTKAPNADCILQKDGNLVIYYTDDKGRRPVWHSGTYKNGSSRLFLTNNGELYILSSDGTKKVLHEGLYWPVPKCTNVWEQTEKGIKIGYNPKYHTQNNHPKNPIDGYEAYAIASGTVMKKATYSVTILHPQLGIYTTYNAITLESKIHTGYAVAQGEIIGKSTPNNLTYIEFQVSTDREGNYPVDPYPYLKPLHKPTNDHAAY